MKIVYVKEGDIWLWTPSSRAQRTTFGDVHRLIISPDGELVAFTRRVDDFHAELWVVGSAAGEARQLVGVGAFDAIAEGVRDTNTVAVNPDQFAWVPGSHHLAFNSYQVFEGPGGVPLDDLQIADADTLERWTLLQPGQGGHFTYSPDGSQVAIVTPTDISLMDANAGNWRFVLGYEQVNTYSEYRYYVQPAWATDGSYLRVAIPPTDPLDQSLSTELWYLPGDGAPAYLVGQIWPVPFQDTPVAFSPDLSCLIYLAETGLPSENRRDLRIAQADGSAERVYQNGVQLRFLGWGPDSNHFAYVSGEEAVALMGILDAPAAPLPGDPYGVYVLHWVDPQHYVVVRQGMDGFELVLSRLDGANLLLDQVSGPPPELDSAVP
jgi:hypothetical protein